LGRTFLTRVASSSEGRTTPLPPLWNPLNTSRAPLSFRCEMKGLRPFCEVSSWFGSHLPRNLLDLLPLSLQICLMNAYVDSTQVSSTRSPYDLWETIFLFPPPRYTPFQHSRRLFFSLFPNLPLFANLSPMNPELVRPFYLLLLGVVVCPMERHFPHWTHLRPAVFKSSDFHDVRKASYPFFFHTARSPDLFLCYAGFPSFL